MIQKAERVLEAVWPEGIAPGEYATAVAIVGAIFRATGPQSGRYAGVAAELSKMAEPVAKPLVRMVRSTKGHPKTGASEQVHAWFSNRTKPAKVSDIPHWGFSDMQLRNAVANLLRRKVLRVIGRDGKAKIYELKRRKPRGSMTNGKPRSDLRNELLEALETGPAKSTDLSELLGYQDNHPVSSELSRLFSAGVVTRSGSRAEGFNYTLKAAKNGVQ